MKCILRLCRAPKSLGHLLYFHVLLSAIARGWGWCWCATQEPWSHVACLWSSFCRNYHLWHWWLLTRSFDTGARTLLSMDKVLRCSWSSRCYQVQLRKSLNLGLLPGKEGAACAAAAAPAAGCNYALQLQRKLLAVGSVQCLAADPLLLRTQWRWREWKQWHRAEGRAKA